MVQATEDILRLDRHSVWDWYLSNDLQIRILAISLFNAKEIKTHFTNTCIKKTLMFYTFTKANTKNIVCIYVYTKTHGLDGCSYISVK